MADGKALLVISQVTSNTDQCIHLAMSFKNTQMSALCKEPRNRAYTSSYISRLRI